MSTRSSSNHEVVSLSLYTLAMYMQANAIKWGGCTRMRSILYVSFTSPLRINLAYLIILHYETNWKCDHGMKWPTVQTKVHLLNTFFTSESYNAISVSQVLDRAPYKWGQLIEKSLNKLAFLWIYGILKSTGPCYVNFSRRLMLAFVYAYLFRWPIIFSWISCGWFIFWAH